MLTESLQLLVVTQKHRLDAAAFHAECQHAAGEPGAETQPTQYGSPGDSPRLVVTTAPRKCSWPAAKACCRSLRSSWTCVCTGTYRVVGRRLLGGYRPVSPWHRPPCKSSCSKASHCRLPCISAWVRAVRRLDTGPQPTDLFLPPGIWPLVLRHIQQEGAAVKQLVQGHLTCLQKVPLGLLVAGAAPLLTPPAVPVQLLLAVLLSKGHHVESSRAPCGEGHGCGRPQGPQRGGCCKHHQERAQISIGQRNQHRKLQCRQLCRSQLSNSRGDHQTLNADRSSSGLLGFGQLENQSSCCCWADQAFVSGEVREANFWPRLLHSLLPCPADAGTGI